MDGLLCFDKNCTHISQKKCTKVEVWEDICGNSQRETKIYKFLRQFA